MRQAMIVLCCLASSAGAGAVELEAPSEIAAGSVFEVRWTGEPHAQDYITIVKPDADDGRYGPFIYVSAGNPVTMRAPDEAGVWQLRYQSDGREGVIARRDFTVAAVTATLSAPTSVVAGGDVPIRWTGPDHQGDFITIVPADAADKTWNAFVYTSSGNPLTMRAPETPGAYEIRYATGQSYSTIAAVPIMVTAAGASLDVPSSAMAGSVIEIGWSGPDNPGDYITVVPTGAPEGQWDHYEYTARGTPLSLATSDNPGDYEVRYATAQSNVTLARSAITLTAASASLEAPDAAVAGETFEVKWTGPGNPSDFITIVVAGAEEGTWKSFAGVHWGSPVTLVAPRQTGEHEIRYATGQSSTTLARRTIQILPGDDPAWLAVHHSASSRTTKPIFEIIMDASGSMLKRDHGEPRIEIARQALTRLVTETLPADAEVALRVFGHLETNSCRTDLVIPLAPLDRSAVRAALAGIQAKNLAKTPIGASLSKVGDDLSGAEGPINVVLVTDGEETCDGDPAAAIADLQRAGHEVQVNIVGFAIDDVMLKETFRAWARMGEGRFFDAADAEGLRRGLAQTLEARFEVLDERGQRVTLGTVNGSEIELAPGTYGVRLLDAQEASEQRIELTAGQKMDLEF